MPAKQESENANAFKLWINRDALMKIARELARVDSNFDQKKFVGLAPRLDSLELKQRVQLVRDQLRKQLPENYLAALKILIDSINGGGLKGFTLWPYTDFIQTYGLDHPRESLRALSQLTELFTAEFAVRPFVIRDPKATLAFLETCATSPNVHLRRWASEGTRPRLPWGERLNIFIQKPELTLPILETLKNDDEIYVRKSVANHLNDISKDHPQLVVKLLKRWNLEAKAAQTGIGAPDNVAKIRWITHRALRSLIKKGDPQALAAIGVSNKAQVKVTSFGVGKKAFKVGEKITIEFSLHSLASKNQRVVVDYIIHFMKSNGSTTPKVFKMKTLDLKAKDVLRIEKRHHLKKVSTRRFYSGAHALEIQVNGVIHARAEWKLI